MAMTTTRYVLMAAMTGLLMTGCSKKPASQPTETTTPGEPAATPAPTGGSERASLTNAECEAKNGRVVGDIGDGAIHRPDYVCESGQPPLGSIRAVDGEPVAIEGSVCCPA